MVWAAAGLAAVLGLVRPLPAIAKMPVPTDQVPAPGPSATTTLADVPIGPAPGWVIPPLPDTSAPPPEGAATRFVVYDNQALAGADALESYSAVRVRLLKPEALALGNLTLTWSPNAGGVKLHWLRVIRQGKIIDLTKSARFTVVRRENGLEQAMLDGRLTAFYQVPDLQVGDELDYAVTVTSFDPTLREFRSGLGLLPQGALPGAFRTRLIWPEARPLRWQASPDVATPLVEKVGRFKAISFELRDPGAPPEPALGAPARFRIVRLVEFSDYSGWDAISRRLWPLYDKASRLKADSPLHAEAARIAAQTSDPVKRAEAALRLVEDRIRYVYVGLDGGNMTPSDADDTWQRRFGDCKGKTALLIALLRDLGIAGEPLLVHSAGGDGLDERLPNPGLFDHVVVRARIRTAMVLLDGTRLGDRTLALLPQMPWRFGLPVTEAGAALEKLPNSPPPWPQGINLLDIDARAGLTQPAPVIARRIIRGDEAAQLAGWFATVPVDQAQRAIRDYWHSEEPWIEGEKASWKLDDATGAMVLTMTGEGDLTLADNDFPARDDGARIPSSSLSTPPRMRRPKSQDQSLPWALPYPSFQCWATTLRLPAVTATQYWALGGEKFSRIIGGAALMRRVGMGGDTVRTVISRRFITPELSATDAAAGNLQIPDFDAVPIYVTRRQTFKGAAKWAATPLPFTDNTDWTAPDNPCMAPPADPVRKWPPAPMVPPHSPAGVN